MKLKIKDAKTAGYNGYEGEAEISQVLVVKGLLTLRVASALGIREGCFAENGVPRELAKYPSPMLRITGGEVAFGDKSFTATLIHKFNVRQPQSGSERDTSLELSFRIHFGADEPIHPWWKRQNGETFELNVSAAQSALEFGAGEDEEQEEEPPSGPCQYCDENVPLGLGGMHENGKKCKDPEKLAAARGTIATAREMKKSEKTADPVQ